MNKAVKIGLVGLGVIAVGYAISSCLKDDKKKNKKKVKKNKQADEKPKASLKSKNTDQSEFPLKLGSKGEKVKRLQVFLMRKLGFVKKPDGVFDETTLKRVQRWFKREKVSEALYKKLQLDRMVHDQRKVKRNGRK